MHNLIPHPAYTSARMQGIRIDLAWADAEWAARVLRTLSDVSLSVGCLPAVILDTSGPEIRVRNTATACLPKPGAAPPPDVKFEAGSDVTLVRGPGEQLSSSTVPVDCSKTFTELAVEESTVLYISSYLSAGAHSTRSGANTCSASHRSENPRAANTAAVAGRAAGWGTHECGMHEGSTTSVFMQGRT
jgi:pyruvate kinase